MKPVWKQSQTQKDAKEHLSEAFDWYRKSFDHKKCVDALVKYAQNRFTPSEIAEISKAEEGEFQKVHAWTADCIANGANLPTDIAARISVEISNLIRVVKIRQRKDRSDSRTPRKHNVQDFIAAKVSEVLGELDEIQDQFTENFKIDFNPVEFLATRDLKNPHLTKIAAWHQRILDELTEVQSDEYMKEAYSLYTKPQIKKWIAHERAILDACQSLSNRKKKRRKKQTKKVDISKVTKEIEYTKDSTEYGIGEPVENIFTTSQAWIFNTKSRILTHLVSKNEEGLSIRGKTIRNFDEKNSSAKRLRLSKNYHPKEVLNRIREGGKVELRKIMDSISSKPSRLSGIISEDTLIVKTI